MDWTSLLQSVGGGLLGPLGDLLFGGLASLEKAGVAGWVEDNYGGLTKAESQSFDRQLSNSLNLQASQYNYNSALMEKQYAMQEQFYQQYQSPEAMVNQYRSSGLNPALMFGQSAQGGSGTSISPQGVSVPAGGGTASGIVGLISALGDIKSSFSQAALNNALAHKAEAEAGAVPSKMKLNVAQAQYYNSLPAKTRAEVNLLYSQDSYLAELGFKAIADARLANVEADQVFNNTKMALKKFDVEVDLLRSAISKNEQEVKESKSREAQNFQYIKESASKVLLNDEMVRYYKELTGKTSVEKQNEIFVKQFILPFQSRLLALGIAKEKAQAAILEVVSHFENANQVAGLVNSYTESLKNVAISGAAVGATVSGFPTPRTPIGY